VLPHGTEAPILYTDPSAAGPDWQPDVREELRLTGANQSREMPPYIRRTQDSRLLVTVAEPVLRNRHSVGIVLLTREAREVDDSVLAVRLSILALFALALALTVGLSWYLSLTIARPILRLAGAAEGMREGSGRGGGMPAELLGREDEIGLLAHALSESARALWARMDAIEQFAADVAHEIKNPLSSIRSAIETLRRIEEPDKQRRLLAIIAEDVGRLDRLISDISDASRIDAELSRVVTEKVDVAPILATLAEINEATRGPGDPHVELAPPVGRLVVLAVEGRLVQVLRNLIGNALSFSPRDGAIRLQAREAGAWVEIAVEDRGPGIPEGKLDHIFDRFYSERPQGERFGQHSGLGLSISRQIVEALKGSIDAENCRDDRGQVLGARFVVRLPKG
jgi:two-component system sensor histidine kinase ChvG